MSGRSRRIFEAGKTGVIQHLVFLLVFLLSGLPAALGDEDFEDGPFFRDDAGEREIASLAPSLPWSGLTVMGGSGLVTIPTPSPIGPHRYRVGVKSAADSRTDFLLGSQTYRTEVSERVLQLSATHPQGAEFSVCQVVTRRSVSPAHVAFDGDDILYNFGVQFSDNPTTPYWTLGAQYAPVSDEQLARMDVDQIAQMRCVYSTVGGAVSRRGTMFVHLRNCFMPEQTWVTSTGQTVRQRGRNLIMVGLAAGWKLGKRHSLFGELTRLDYQGLLDGGNRRWQANAGARFATRLLTLECLGRSLETDPTLIAGVTASY